MYVERAITEDIKLTSKGYQIISITGPRQSGKTTLTKELYPDYTYQNLESIETREFATRDPKGFLNQSSRMIIDEAQYVPDLFSYIQVITDEKRNKRFVLTGSQNFSISEKISQSLAGRVAIYRLLPFTNIELNNANWLEDNSSQQIINGSYPRIYDRNLDASKWYQEYTETYIERDVRIITNIGQVGMFYRFLQMVAGRCGQLLNYESISSDLGVSPNTVKQWISILEQTYIIFRLEPYFANISKRVAKSPKIHFYDTGLLCSLLGIKTVDQLEKYPIYGNIYENFIVAELIKQNINIGETFEPYFYQDRKIKEVDLLLKQSDLFHAYEIKAAATFDNNFTKNILKYEKEMKRDIDKHLILNIDESYTRENFNVTGWRNLKLP